VTTHAGSGFSKETSKGFTKTTNQDISTLGLEAEKAGENARIETRFSAGKKRKYGKTDEIQTIIGYKFGGKSLVLLQVNSRSI
jgi:hypothetical protein